MVDYSTYNHALGIPDNSLEAAQWYYGSDYPNYDWSAWSPWLPEKSQVVETVFGPSYTPQEVNTPTYQGTWPYTPAVDYSTPGYTMGSTPVEAPANYYGSSGGYSGGGGGDIAPGPTLPIWDPYNALMQLLPSPGMTPQEQYQYYTAPQLQALGNQIMPIVYQQSSGRGNTFPSWEEIRDQAQKLIGTSSAWAPGGEKGVGQRRTVEQQAEYEKAMTPLWNWVAPLPPITGSGDAMYDIQRRQASEQQAWDLWKPALQQLLGPETMKGGQPNWLKPASAISGVAPYRTGPSMASSVGSSWSFAPRWG